LLGCGGSSYQLSVLSCRPLRVDLVRARDPSNLRQQPLTVEPRPTPKVGLRLSLWRPSEAVQQTTADMSFRLPAHVPNFDNAQRRFEDNVWNKFTGKEDGLPMYKDKPAGYGAQRQVKRWCGGKRRVGLAIAAVMGVLYWMGGLGVGGTEGGETRGKEWNIIPGVLSGKNGKVDWEKRRESVRDAFLLSWKGYEEHGWGKSRSCLRRSRSRRS
jgi:hypothetical protein